MEEDDKTATRKRIVIAIDGFSSTGKSTIAKRIASRLNYIYVDTGAMYRAVTYFALKHGYIKGKKLDEAGLIKDLNEINITFELNEELGFAEVYLNGSNIESDIRTLEVSRFVSLVAALSEVRKKLGKKITKPTRQDILTDEYRKKKGLSPLKKSR